MTPLQFVDKWRPVTLTERAAAQSHFLDLCRLFDHPTPVEADPTGERFTFEKGVQKSGGGKGFADVWMRNHFAWEYKKKHRDLDAALGQLARYALALESPPLHIVCDTDRFRIVTAYTNSAPRSYDLSLEELLDPKKRGWLEAAFRDPRKLKPGADRADLTKEAANKFSTLALRLQGKGQSKEEVGHFVNRLVFLFFAEDVGLLEPGFFRKAVASLAGRPAESKSLLTGLFHTFKTGGRFGLDRLPHINGGLFDDQEALPLDDHEVGLLIAAGSQDWSHIDPTIFGTLFERFLDPDKRAQIGAHYTDAGKIKQIIDPVILRPLREEWEMARTDIQALVTRAKAKGNKSKDWQRAEERRARFLERLRTLSILDPACGSGNFLYLALHGVKNLEHAANQECEAMGLPPLMPMVGPEILCGIELNPLAAELARTTVWIGDIQWALQNGIRSRPEPILRKLNNIENRDAIIDISNLKSAAKWPDAEFIVGNPPFLGGKLLRRRMGSDRVDSLFRIYNNQVPKEADLVTYWFANLKEKLLSGATKRAGFVAPNSVRNGINRTLISEIIVSHSITDAWSDEAWPIDGAAVRVSLICFGPKVSSVCFLDGKQVSSIYANLTAGATNLSEVKELLSNKKIAFMGNTKGGSFDVAGDLARKWLLSPHNANGRPNSDVLRPWRNGADIARRQSDTWIIDFNKFTSSRQCSYYADPYAYILKYVKPKRLENNRLSYAEFWWRHVESRPAMSEKLATLPRFIVTPEAAKHRIFTWMESGIVPDHQLQVIATESDAIFGILHSKFHEAWVRALGSPYGNHPTARRYNISRVFETFPFPIGLEANSAPTVGNNLHVDLVKASQELFQKRQNWLNPRDFCLFEPEVVPGYPQRLVPTNSHCEKLLRSRTLNNLYNLRGTAEGEWLDELHRDVDAAVAVAYGWPKDLPVEDALSKLLELNRERAAAQEAA